MSDHPFEPPVAERDPAVYTWLVVFGSWALSGATVGTAIGATLQLTRGQAGAGAAYGLGGMAVALLLGVAAYTVERARAEHRPELTDMRGVRSRPFHGALLGVPVMSAVPALLWLVIVGSYGLRSPLPAITFSMAALGVAWAGLRVWSNHHLARALEALEGGRVGEARAGLEALAARRLASRGARVAARLNLAMLALNDGDGEGAVFWADARPGTGAFAWAAVAKALGHLLRGDPPDEAEHWLGQAQAGPGGRAVQPEADAVRLLLVWRTQGERDARELGERLHGPEATVLHRALLAMLRERTGDVAGARALRSDDVHALVSGGMGRAIPELSGMR